MSKKLTPGIVFDDYDKISDDIIYFGNGITLRFVVSLSKKNQDGTKDFFHKEFSYPSKYLNKERGVSIKRSFDFYLVFDIREDFDSSVQIRMKDMIIMQMKLNETIKWFGTLFKIKNKKMVIMGEYNPIIIPNLSLDKWIKLEPIVIEFDDERYKEGIRLSFPNNYYIDIHIDRFMELVYFFNTFNMYQSAITLLSYLEPDFGSNIISYEKESKNPNLIERQDPGYGNIKSYTLPSDKRKIERKESFFDKMDKL